MSLGAHDVGVGVSVLGRNMDTVHGGAFRFKNLIQPLNGEAPEFIAEKTATQIKASETPYATRQKQNDNIFCMLILSASGPATAVVCQLAGKGTVSSDGRKAYYALWKFSRQIQKHVPWTFTTIHPHADGVRSGPGRASPEGGSSTRPPVTPQPTGIGDPSSPYHP